MGNMGIIIKRKGHSEEFDDRKVYASCYSACINTHHGKEESEQMCSQVSDAIKLYLGGKEEISSDDIFRETIRELNKIDSEAAFMYESHRDVS